MSRKTKEERRKEISKYILSKCAQGDYGIYAPPIDVAEAFWILTDFFLGENYLSPNPINSKQVATEMLYSIMMSYKDVPERHSYQKIYGSGETTFPLYTNGGTSWFRSFVISFKETISKFFQK